MSEPILYHVTDGIGVLQVNRPTQRNALNWAAQDAFAARVREIAADRTLRALVITGTGAQAFVSGGDLKELAAEPEKAAGARLNRTMSGALAGLGELPVPVLAAVNGDAFGGGCELALACDLRLAAAHARFGFAQVRTGLTTGWGGAARLVRQLGQSRAMELLLTGRTLNAAEAQAIGLVHRVVPPGTEVLDAALAWAHELVALPADALAALKLLVEQAGRDGGDVAGLETQLFVQLWNSPNHREALRAFLEKRAPDFNAAE